MNTRRDFHRRLRALRLPMLALAVAGLSACVSPGPAGVSVAQTRASQAGLTEDAPALQVQATDLSLGDARLAALITQALAGQPSLLTAQARVRRAQALAGLSQASHGPQASLGLDLARQRYTENGLVPAPVAGNIYNSGTLQAGASWAPDFFGQHAAELQAALGQARAAQAESAAAALGLSHQIARGYVALARSLAQRGLLRQMLALRERTLALTRQRIDAGVEDRQALTPAELAVQELHGQLAQLDEQIGLQRRQLALLSGQAPQALDALAPTLAGLHLPALPQQVGADLLGRRPDVVAARWRVEAAGQDVGVARSQFYPNVNLGAFVGLNALGLDRLLQADSLQWGVTPAVRLPLFDAGRLRAQLGVKQADLDAAIAQYNTQVLEAARDAADGLGSLAALPPQEQAQAAAQTSAEAGLALAHQRRSAGLSGDVPLLNAQATLLAQRQQGVVLQARRLDAGLALIKALGGGWVDDTERLGSAAR